VSNLVYVGGGKGGSSKTTMAHWLCLGAILCRQPAAYVLTDLKREPKPAGRPYGVLDGRDPTKLAQIIATYRDAHNGWLFIDGGGNRPAFDTAIAAEVTLCLLPFRDSDEDADSVKLDLAAIPNSLAWPSAWPTNRHAQQAAERYMQKVKTAFPLRVITPPVYFVNSAKELLADVLGDPSTVVRSEARRAFGIMADHFEQHGRHSAMSIGKVA
jgi:hypothetical protein